MSLGDRSCRVLTVIAAQPGASNREVAYAAEVSDDGQILKAPCSPEEPRADRQPGTVARWATPLLAPHGAGQAGRAGKRRGATAPREMKGDSCSPVSSL